MRLAARPAIARIVTIDRELRSGKYPNAATLAAKIEVDRRTVQRDLQFLRDRLEAPLAFDRKRNGYYYAEPTWALPLPTLTEGEMVALLLAERVLRQYEGNPYLPVLRRAFRKICSRLPQGVSFDAGAFDRALSFRGNAPMPQDLHVFHALFRALRRKESVWIRYWTAHRDETGERTVDPYHLACVAGDWYLIAHDHRSGEVRIFAPSRIRALRATGRRFTVPESFRAEEYLAGAFRIIRGKGSYRVRLLFSGEAARYVRERTWHPTQEITVKEDGGILLAMTLNDLREVARWALSWGRGCRALSPPDLVTMLRDEASALWRTYRVPGG